MYITTTLANTRSTENFQPPFSSAERNITEKDAPQIFTILGGPSPWQHYLRRNLDAHSKDLPAKPMRIVNDGEFARRYKGIFGEAPPASAQGFVDRANATIVLREFPTRNFNQSKAGLALHEAVHLFSHPPGRSNRLRATVYGLLEKGLLEGLTQIITEDIQAKQDIRPLRADWQAYGKYIPVARKFIQIFTPGLVGDAYFNGTVTPLINAIIRRWTAEGLDRVRRLTNQEQPEQALQAIETLEQAYRSRPRVIEFQQVFRGSRWPQARLGQPTAEQEQRKGTSMSDVESFGKVVADHYVRTEYPTLSVRVKRIWCSGDKKMCEVQYSTGIQVLVSFVRLPDHVIARRGEDPTGPRCEYDFDCRSSAERVLKKRSCAPG